MAIQSATSLSSCKSLKKRPKKRLWKVARILSKIIVGLLALWAASAFIAEIMGVYYFISI